MFTPHHLYYHPVFGVREGRCLAPKKGVSLKVLDQICPSVAFARSPPLIALPNLYRTPRATSIPIHLACDLLRIGSFDVHEKPHPCSRVQRFAWIRYRYQRMRGSDRLQVTQSPDAMLCMHKLVASCSSRVPPSSRR